MSTRRKKRKLKTPIKLLLIALIIGGVYFGFIKKDDVHGLSITKKEETKEVNKENNEPSKEEIEKIEFDPSLWEQVIDPKDEIPDYPVIKLDSIENYPGVGQQIVPGMDGYFTTFTTYGEHKKIYKEYKQNGSSSWKDKEYWGNTMEKAGCGITALSIILSGYGFNYTPGDFREKYQPVFNYNQFPAELRNVYNIENSGFIYYNSSRFSKDLIIKHLNSNRPIITCIWTRPTANRWTKVGHYMALLATDNDNKVYISNPNGLYNSFKSSGWYDINEVLPYMYNVILIEKY